MIQSFRHKGLRRFYESESLAGIQPQHAIRLRMQLAALDSAQVIEDMDIPGFRLHPLRGADRSQRREPGDGIAAVEVPRPFAGELDGDAVQPRSLAGEAAGGLSRVAKARLTAAGSVGGRSSRLNHRKVLFSS